MSRYEFVMSTYDTIDDKYIDEKINSVSSVDMDNIASIDHFTSNFTFGEVKDKLREANPNNNLLGSLRIRYYVGDEARYFTPIYDNDLIYDVSYTTTKREHSNKIYINDSISVFKKEREKLQNLLRGAVSKDLDKRNESIREINSIFPHDTNFKKAIINLINLDIKESYIKDDYYIVYESELLNEFANYTVFRSWVIGNIKKDLPLRKNNDTNKENVNVNEENIPFSEPKIIELTTEEKNVELNSMFTEEDREEFLDEDELIDAGYSEKHI